jgi:hypothetical protein
MAGKYNFTIEQGATFSRVITWKDGANNLVDLSGKTAKMQIRDSKNAVILTLTDTSGIALGGTAGTITINRTADQTRALAFDTAKYDLEITTGSNVKRLLQGVITLDPEVTL